jgi:hypothetical protein
VAKVVSSGVFKINKLSNLDIYPNPVTDRIYFQNDVSGSELSIFNTAGTLVLKQTISGKTIMLDNKMIQAGTYIWTVLTENKTLSKGILIKN